MRKHKTYQNKNFAASLPSFRQDLRFRPHSASARHSASGLFTHERLYKSRKVTLIDALDRVIDKGAYIDGELVLRVADIDLVFIGLRLIVTSVSNAERLRNECRMGTQASPSAEDFVCIRKLEEQLRDIEASIPKIIDAGNPEKAE